MRKILFKTAVSLCLLCLVCTCLVCCKSEQAQTKSEVKGMLSALSKNDPDRLYSYMNKSIITQSELEDSFYSMYEALGGKILYSLKNTSYEVTEQSGVTSLRADYMLTTLGGEVFEIQVRRLGGYDGYAGFVIRKILVSDSENLSPPYEQAGILFYTLACLAFCIFMAYDCVKRLGRVSKKLCIIWFIIIFCGISLRFVFSSGTLSFLPYPSVALVPSGIISVSKAGRLILFLPLGCIVYFISRKRLTSRQNTCSANGQSTGEEQEEKENVC